jgi:hypothetical protein
MNTASPNSQLLTTRILLGSLVCVGLSTAALAEVTGYGTVLSQIVVLGAWSLVAAVTSGTFADMHQPILWIVTFVLNVALFGVPAGTVFWLLRRRAPFLCVSLLVGWLLFYMASLFVLFPATDGP